jgi:hypothetical protein
MLTRSPQIILPDGTIKKIVKTDTKKEITLPPKSDYRVGVAAELPLSEFPVLRPHYRVDAGRRLFGDFWKYYFFYDLSFICSCILFDVIPTSEPTS